MNGADVDVLAKMIVVIVRGLVNRPDEVRVTLSTETLADEGVRNMLTLRVAPEDTGVVIGERGRMAQSLRTILMAAASKRRVCCQLQIEVAA